ncbi:CDP-alcohol phosphatidyltransferase [Dictyocaulus viviparus]|uniref:CDP-alcohol phosphatidyltransferase n=1 Tax=Dictyocaulus viviparus TaxID=29172 RepID=A0A0D8X9Z8_DICVI|nr:CDP-alcohol phosphatidyltransferase [Dictyocaulus viviparus]
MVVTRSSIARIERERRDRYTYAPRSQPLITDTIGYKYIDSYLEYDCLLTAEELHRLSEHKYSAVDISWLDELCMKYFWEWIVKFYPLWKRDFQKDDVEWNILYLIFAFELVFRKDICHYGSKEKKGNGKQARRTGAASPLGELFDHGCDSISQVFVTLNAAYAMRLGDVKCGTFFVVVIAVCLFYCAHWSTYCTGQLRFSKFDVTEAQMTIILLLLVTAILGPHVWSIGIVGYQLRHLLLFGTFFAAIYQCSSYLTVIFTGGVGRNGSTVAGTSVIFPVCPLLASVVPFCMIYSKSHGTVFDESITLFVLCFGAVSAKATNRLIVAHMSRSELVLWDWIYLGPIILMLNHSPTSIHIMSQQIHCAFIIQKKQRRCRMLTKAGQKYCGEHAIYEEQNQERIQCPNDPKHTVFRRKLFQHLQRCNSRLLQEKWIVKNINAVEADTITTRRNDRKPTEEDIKKLINKLNMCYTYIRDEVQKQQLQSPDIESHLKKFSDVSKSKRKHLVQQSSIIGHLQSVMVLKNEPSNCIFELGAGKAQLSYWLTKIVPSAGFLLIDRSGSRNKFDNRALQEVSSICAVSKHFCGSATDAGIKCISNGVKSGLAFKGFALAPCCHHKLRDNEYCGHDFLKKWNMSSHSDFAVLRLIASWAVCGITKVQGGNNSESNYTLSVDQNTVRNGNIETENKADIGGRLFDTANNSECLLCDDAGSLFVPWSPQWKEEMGRRAKVVLEIGRARYLTQFGFSTRVIEYVPREISPENLLILGVKH